MIYIKKVVMKNEQIGIFKDGDSKKSCGLDCHKFSHIIVVNRFVGNAF